MAPVNRETNESNSRTSAYEALSTLATHSARDTLPAISKLTLDILGRAEHLLSVQDQIVGTDDRNNYNELQINFCGVLTVSGAQHKLPDASHAGR